MDYTKSMIPFCLWIGAVIGATIPLLWGAPFFSRPSIILAILGGFIGILIGFRLHRW